MSATATTTFYGVRLPRAAGPAPHVPVIDFSGTSQMIGGILIDGNTSCTSARLEQRRDGNFDDATASRPCSRSASAGMVQNTWREITKSLIPALRPPAA